ncbi:hypothetical protein Tco_0191171 [Tanacetum coccineum]
MKKAIGAACCFLYKKFGVLRVGFGDGVAAVLGLFFCWFCFFAISSMMSCDGVPAETKEKDNGVVTNVCVELEMAVGARNWLGHGGSVLLKVCVKLFPLLIFPSIYNSAIFGNTAARMLLNPQILVITVIQENYTRAVVSFGDHIVDFPEGKIGVYTKKFEFANFRIPISQFLFDILGYYQIHLSQLSVIGAAKVSHFEINCRVLNIIPTVNLFRVFYVPSYNSGWMSFSKRPGKNTPQCYTKPLDSLKNWNNRFFWVDEKVFPTVVAWRTAATKDDKPQANTYSVVDVTTLDTHRTPFQKQPEELLCLVGFTPELLLTRRQEFGYVQSYQSPNPTRSNDTGETRKRNWLMMVPLMTATASRVIQMVDATELSTSFGLHLTVDEGRPFGKTPTERCGEEGSKAQQRVLRNDCEPHVLCAQPPAGGKIASGDECRHRACHPCSRDTGASRHDANCQYLSSKEKGVAGDQDSERSTPSPPITN